MQCEVPLILNIKVARIILCVKNILPNDILLLKGNDGVKYWKHSKYFALCYLLIDNSIYPKLIIVPHDLFKKYMG